MKMIDSEKDIKVGMRIKDTERNACCTVIESGGNVISIKWDDGDIFVIYSCYLVKNDKFMVLAGE